METYLIVIAFSVFAFLLGYAAKSDWRPNEFPSYHEKRSHDLSHIETIMAMHGEAIHEVLKTVDEDDSGHPEQNQFEKEAYDSFNEIRRIVHKSY